ncbi:MAG: glycoside hydrolase family 28 protein, partial [Odoribacter sp.]|nr:glycoside hydrolase family 28 protein [Odoribacter sp.]
MKYSILIFFLIIVFTACQKAANSDIPSFDWVEGNVKPDLSWISDVGARTLPKGKTILIDSYNPDKTGKTFAGEIIQAAIDECAKNGGGTVELTSGTYLTGALFIKSNVNLHIGEGVTLIASEYMEHYPESRTRVAGIEMVWPAAVLNIVNQQNAAITGTGKIDCRGEYCWNNYWEMRRQYEKDSLRWIVDYDCKRIRGLLVQESSDITLQGFTMERTGFWAVQILYSDHCTLDGLIIRNNVNGHGPSTDGLDIDSSSRILIENCDIDCNDDNICLKAGRDADGIRVNRPTEYVIIRDCITRRGVGLITCGSETSGSIRYILGYNLKAQGTNTAIRLKSAINRGGTVEHVYITQVEADSVRLVLGVDLNWNPSYSYSKLPNKFEGKEVPEHWHTMLTRVDPLEKGYPHFKNIFISDVKAKNAASFLAIAGANEDLRVENFQLYDFNVTAKTAGNIKYSSDFILKDIHLQT